MITVTTALSTGLRELADLLDQHPELPTPKVQVYWHNADDPTLAAIVAAVPDVTWSARASGATEWIETRTDTRIELTVFSAPPARTLDTSRLEALLADAKPEPSTASHYTCPHCEAQLGIFGEHTGSDDDYAADEYFDAEVERHESGECLRTALSW